MNFKIILISAFLIFVVACQSSAKSIGSEIEFSKNEKDIRVLTKREAGDGEENEDGSQSSAEEQESESQSDSQSESSSQSSAETEETEKQENDTKNEAKKEVKTEKDESNSSKNTKENVEPRKGCPCKSCSKKNSTAKSSTSSTKCPCGNCQCENCPKKKGCPFMNGLLGRTQNPIAAVATEFIKALQSALNGTNSSRNINIIVAIAGAGGSVQIKSTDGNVTTLGNASVKVVEINGTQGENISTEADENEIESAEITTVSQSASENTSDSTAVPNVSTTIESNTAASSDEPESVDNTTVSVQSVSSASEETPTEDSTASA